MTTRSSDHLLAEADAWFERNRGRLERPSDPVFESVMVHAPNPCAAVLEIGCSNGWRLERLRTALGASVAGLEAGRMAVEEARTAHPHIEVVHGLAPGGLAAWDSRSFDVVVLGFFQYLLPRECVFELAAQVDRVLRPGGLLVVNDFLHPQPISVEYAHRAALTTYKGDPSAPWSWSPAYTLVSRGLSGGSLHAGSSTWETVDVLVKNSVADAYPGVVQQGSR